MCQCSSIHPHTDVGGLQMRLATSSDDSATHVSFSKWSHDYAPLSMVSIEAYTLPGKIRHIHSQKVQDKGECIMRIFAAGFV